MAEIARSLTVREPSAALIGMCLTDLSTRLVAQWCGVSHLKSRAPVEDSFSDGVLRAHIPALIGSIGAYISDPAFDVRRAMLAQIRANSSVWRQLDCCAGDLMAGLDRLSQLITQRMEQELAQRAGGARLAMAVFARLCEGLRIMSSVIIEQCLERESNYYQESARQQEERNLVLIHELRTSLHTIALSAAILESPMLRTSVDGRKSQLKIVRSAVAHAKSLLRYADEENGSQKALNLPSTMPLQALMETIAEEQDSRATASGVTLSLLGDAPSLAVDSLVGRLVLSNLVVNAIKYSGPAKEGRWVTVQAEVPGGDDMGFVTVEVADNGIGIPVSLQQRVFDRRFRVHPHLADGLGLGLAIVQRSLLDCGGSIALTSQEKIGTVVRVRLPAWPIAR